MDYIDFILDTFLEEEELDDAFAKEGAEAFKKFEKFVALSWKLSAKPLNATLP